MNKSIVQLKKAKNMQFTATALALVLLVIILLALHVNQLLVLLLLPFIGVPVSYIIIRSYQVNAGKRLTTLAATEMDPQVLATEMAEAYANTTGSAVRSFGRLYYQAACHAMLGEHEKALAAWESMPLPSEKYRAPWACGVLITLVRCGQLTKAASYLDTVSKILDSDSKMALSCHQALGAYHTAAGNLEKGYLHLSQALQLSRFRVEQMGTHFDLAQLKERDDKSSEAIIHYRTAADLGPKTWLGQEAARRGTALQGAMNQTAEAEAHP